MADDEQDDAGGGAPEALIVGDEKHVDDSQLKIAAFDSSQFTGRLASGEENDEVLFQTCVRARWCVVWRGALALRLACPQQMPQGARAAANCGPQCGASALCPLPVTLWGGCS